LPPLVSLSVGVIEMKIITTTLIIFAWAFVCTAAERNEMNQFKMVITDVFNIKTRKGPVVVGVIERGSVSVGDHLKVCGNSQEWPVEVVSIEKFQQPGLSTASAGPDDVGIELYGISAEEIKYKYILRK
jgi:translation elongation factor EF-Tu-like GTPase